jgi:flagellar biosynthesis protein FlhA
MTFVNAAQKFTLLTVGDGLVSQIPGLIISVASGIVVTRAAGGGGLSDELSSQFLIHPKAIYICSLLLAVLAVLPGFPTVPFFLLASGCFFFARSSQREVARRETESLTKKDEKDREERGRADSIEQLLHVDVLALEVGVGLIPLVDSQQDGEILERIVSTRKQFAQEMGIIVPIVMVRDNIQLRPGEYQILLKGNPVANGNLMADYMLAMAPEDISDPVDGITTREPAYGLDAVWIKQKQHSEGTPWSTALRWSSRT